MVYSLLIARVWVGRDLSCTTCLHPANCLKTKKKGRYSQIYKHFLCIRSAAAGVGLCLVSPGSCGYPRVMSSCFVDPKRS